MKHPYKMNYFTKNRNLSVFLWVIEAAKVKKIKIGGVLAKKTRSKSGKRGENEGKSFNLI